MIDLSIQEINRLINKFFYPGMSAEAWHYDQFARAVLTTFKAKQPNPEVQPITSATEVAQRDELLEVLNDMVEMMDSGVEHGAGSSWHKKAKAAIAKVEGKTE